MNRDLQQHAKKNYRVKLEEMNKRSIVSNKEFNTEKFIPISQFEKEKIKEEVRRKIRNQSIMSYVKAVISLIILVLVICWAYKMVGNFFI